MRLYDGKSLAAPRRVTTYLKEKGIEIERIEIDARGGENRKPEFLRINSAGKLPVLELDDGTHLPESAAIVEYLEERFPKPSMLGETPEKRAQIRATERIAGDIFVRLPFILLHSPTEEAMAKARGVTQHPQVVEVLRPSAEALLDQLEFRMGDGEFLAGDRPTVADCTFFAYLDTTYRFFQYRLPDRLPRLIAWYARFSKRPSAQIG